MTRRRSASTALALLLIAAPLVAQSSGPAANTPDQASPAVTAPAPASAVIADVAPSLAPTMANVAVGVRATATAASTVPAPFQGSVGRNPAMMIVGGVALIVGSFLDDPARPIVMVSGAVVGIYGLWQYLK